MKPIAFVLAAYCALVAWPSGAAAQTSLTFGSTLPLFGAGMTDIVVPWMRAIEGDSGGTVKFKEFYGGQLIQNPAKEYDAVINGITDATILVTPFTQQVFPDSSIFALPSVVQSAVEAADGGWKMHEAGLLRGMDKLYVAAVYSNDPGAIHFAKKQTSLDQMKGLKIRVSGPAEAALVQALGGAPVGMNVMEAAEGLSRGLYDGTLNGWGANSSYRITPVLKSHFDLSLGVRQFLLVISRSAYDALPDKAKRAVDKNSGLDLSLRLGKALDAEGIKERAEAREKGAMVALSDADKAKLDGIFKPVIDKWIADTPDGAKKMAFLQQRLVEFRKSGAGGESR